METGCAILTFFISRSPLGRSIHTRRRSNHRVPDAAIGTIGARFSPASGKKSDVFSEKDRSGWHALQSEALETFCIFAKTREAKNFALKRQYSKHLTFSQEYGKLLKET